MLVPCLAQGRLTSICKLCLQHWGFAAAFALLHSLKFKLPVTTRGFAVTLGIHFLGCKSWPLGGQRLDCS